ncbi:MAG: flavodoxin family protein [Candidatus Sigynarchaeota archaeon]
MNVWIVYDSKYGNNKQIAEALAGLFKEGNEVHVHHAKDVSPKEAAESKPDILLFGGPPRAGMISFTIKGWARKFASALKSKGLQLKKAAVWGTHAVNNEETPPKFAWPSIEPKWKALLAEMPAAKSMPGVLGINIMDKEGGGGLGGILEAGWKDLVASFAEGVKTL